ncbi:MAG: penicillin-binding protein 1C, partial [Planctomycetes bacterium]|nr:penicillin-binding protein 1C [Planctomycetota bacterium]
EGGAAEVLDREGGLIAWRVDMDDNWRVPVELKRVSPWLISATIAAEDKRFMTHGGVDLMAACRAAAQNIRYGRRISGASTITMQSIRLLLPRERTWSTKASESFRALQIERQRGKEDILQLYLNLAPYGGNVIGAEAAARHYFGKSAFELTLGEASLLAGIPQSPARFNPRKHLDEAMKRREFVLARLLALGLATGDEISKARREPIVIIQQARQTQAPRFVDFLLQHRKQPGGIINTTIDPRAQTIAQDVIEKHYRELHPAGVDGMATVVIDVNEASLAAMVGSANPEDPASGCINGATALRQPGSLLKPFIYAIAYESGRLTPDATVYDVPSAWKGYRPENMDREYMGPIPAAEALRLSRNIPAVRLLETIGEDALSLRINSMGLRTAANTGRYGLSLALGTAEMRLVDLANAYATLARMGSYVPLRVSKGDTLEKGKKIFSPSSTWLTLRSLGMKDKGAACQVVWKTGTSWNQRDAWAIVITPRRVAAVWCGCLSGIGNSKLTGAEAALPIALEIMGSLEGPSGKPWLRPDGVRTRKVCAISGEPAGFACSHTIDGEYIPGVSDDSTCGIHRITYVCGKAKAETRWPPEVEAFMATSRRNPEASAAKSKGIAVLSPRCEGEYVICPADQTLPRELELIAGGGKEKKIYWYLDGRLLGLSNGGESLRWMMQPGEHEVVAADSLGESRSVRFSVRQMD